MIQQGGEISRCRTQSGWLGHDLEVRGEHLKKQEGLAGAGQVLGDRSGGSSPPIFLLFLSL